MINLLPQEEKAQIHREYNLRRLTVALILFFILTLVANILLFPSYILMYYRVKSALSSQKIQPTADETTQRTALTASLQQSSRIIVALKSATTTAPAATDVISTILNDTASGNSITSISYTPSTSGPFQAAIQGTAKDRASLQQFVTSLRSEPLIGSVNLPVSDFAQDTSIDFSFTIVGKDLNSSSAKSNSKS